jgi:4-aminobutyrate aminotransferase-like enzyme
MTHHFNMTPKKVPLVETKFRKVATEMPNPETLKIIQECLKYEPLSMNDQLPVVWDKAIDFQVFDKSGNCWIDFTSTIFVANVGHSNPKVAAAIAEALKKNLLNAYYYQTGYRSELTKKLVEITPANMNKVLLLSTGSEATEVALKTAMSYGRRIKPTKDIVLGFEGSFHGKTMGAQTLGGKPGGKKWIKQLQPNIFHLEYPYPWVLADRKISGESFFYENLKKIEQQGADLSDVAAVMAEPYQGWCSVFFPKDYMKAVRAWCTKNNTLLGFDEVQAGFGRTGKMFGFEHFDVIPDLIWCGKALSASIPVSAVIASESFFGEDYSLNSTHGGNPLGAAASIASINFIQEQNLLSESTRKGQLIKQELEAWRNECPSHIAEIYGEGMVWAVFVRDPNTKELDIDLVDRVIERAMEKGVLSIRTQCGTIKLGPPLTTPDAALIEGIGVLKESLLELI